MVRQGSEQRHGSQQGAVFSNPLGGEPIDSLLEPVLEVLPDWAIGLVVVGARLHRYDRAEADPIAVCLTVPRRTMAAALIALGASLSSLIVEDETTFDEHYQALCDAGVGSPIAVLKSGRLCSGWLVGPDRVMGYECIAYDEKSRGGPRRTYLFKNRCMDIQLLPAGVEPFSVAREPFRDPASEHFLEQIAVGASGIAATDFECASTVVSVAARMEEDVDESLFVDDSAIPLIDLVRPDRFMSLGVPTRTRVVSSSVPELAETHPGHEGLVVFDGSQAYLRLQYEFDAPTSIVVLDRWDGQSEAAAAAFITENAPYRTPVAVNPSLLSPGIEALAYQGDA